MQVLGINIGALCDHVPASTVHVSKANGRPLINTAANGSAVGVILERLVPHGVGHQLQGNIHIIPPGHGSVGSITHEGEEIGYVLAGRLDLTIGKETFRLMEGDSFVFSSGLDHCLPQSRTQDREGHLDQHAADILTFERLAV